MAGSMHSSACVFAVVAALLSGCDEGLGGGGAVTNPEENTFDFYFGEGLCGSTTLTTVDVDNCGSTSCTYIHKIATNTAQCVKPTPATDQCHRYVTKFYTPCVDLLQPDENLKPDAYDTADLFDGEGALRACAEKVTATKTVCYQRVGEGAPLMVQRCFDGPDCMKETQ